MNPLAIQISPNESSNTEWESILFTRYQYALAVVLEIGELRDAIEADAAWRQWLLSYLPDQRQRDAIPTPRLLRDIFNREGKPS
jgi:hypothetical protein